MLRTREWICVFMCYSSVHLLDAERCQVDQGEDALLVMQIGVARLYRGRDEDIHRQEG